MKTSIFIKHISIVSVSVFIFSCLSCTTNPDIKTPEVQEREMVLKQHIKSISVFQTDYRNGISQERFLAQIRTYNADGFRTDELNYYDNLGLNSKLNFEYDKNGNLILTTSKGDAGNLIFREERKYNKLNKRTELIFYLPDGSYKYRNVATYDKAGNLLQLAYYWPDGLKSINKFTYKNHLKTEDAEYDPAGKFNYKWIFTYDKMGNETTAIQYYPDSIVNAKIESEFGENNQLLSQTTFYRNTLRSRFLFEYDKKQLLSVKTKFSSASIISTKYEYEYKFN